MLIKDIMTKNPVCVTEETQIVEASEIMKKNNFSKLPVLDKSKKLVGIITKNDILKVSPSDATTLDKYEVQTLLQKLTCGKCMTKKVVTVSENEVVEESAKIMIEKGIGCVPVISDGVLVGIVTESDLFELFTHMLGAHYSGVRFAVKLSDKTGVLAAITASIAQIGGNIVSVVTSDSDDNKKVITAKVEGITLKQMNEILDKTEAEILDIRQV